MLHVALLTLSLGAAAPSAVATRFSAVDREWQALQHPQAVTANGCKGESAEARLRHVIDELSQITADPEGSTLFKAWVDLGDAHWMLSKQLKAGAVPLEITRQGPSAQSEYRTKMQAQVTAERTAARDAWTHAVAVAGDANAHDLDLERIQTQLKVTQPAE